ncbi:MAG TPA: transketolase C-terminal domain-containing protein, partial [Acidimicrobiales bacterium]|nr:transketolase C-terminal domain-containing protein [Acidimicrobiales bacterium]
LDRAGITGDDGPSHHGVLDMALALRIPGMTVFAPSSVEEVRAMLRTALTLDGPALVRWPKGTPRSVPESEIGTGLRALRLREGGGDACILAVGKLVGAAVDAAALLTADGTDATVWDVRVVKPLDPEMLADAARHDLVVTVEDGVRVGGAGSLIADALAALGHRGSVVQLGTPDTYIPHGKADAVLAALGLDAAGVAASVQAALALRATTA